MKELLNTFTQKKGKGTMVPLPYKITSLLLHLKIKLPVYFHQFLWMLKIAKSVIKNLPDYPYCIGKYTVEMDVIEIWLCK